MAIYVVSNNLTYLNSSEGKSEVTTVLKAFTKLPDAIDFVNNFNYHDNQYAPDPMDDYVQEEPDIESGFWTNNGKIAMATTAYFKNEKLKWHMIYELYIEEIELV